MNTTKYIKESDKLHKRKERLDNTCYDFNSKDIWGDKMIDKYKQLADDYAELCSNMIGDEIYG